MTIDDKLYAILNGAIAALGGRVSGGSAPRGTATPYLVYQCISSPKPLRTQQDQALGERTRKWVFQVSIYADSNSAAVSIMASVSGFLESFTDRPAAGIQRIVGLTERGAFDQTEEHHIRAADFDIMENLV